MDKLAALSSIGITGVNVCGLYHVTLGADLEVSSFAPGDGIPEDPVVRQRQRVRRCARPPGRRSESALLRSCQGCVGRDGRVAIEFEDDTIWLGGHAVTCIEGSLKI